MLQANSEIDSTNARRSPVWEHFLVWTPVLLIVLLFLYRTGVLQGHAAQTAAEQEVLRKLSGLLELSPTATKDELFVRASIYTTEHDEARKAHIARQVGLALNWDRIFERIWQLKPAAQSDVARVIAREYSLSENLTLTQMKQYVSSTGHRHVPGNPAFLDQADSDIMQGRPLKIRPRLLRPMLRSRAD